MKQFILGAPDHEMREIERVLLINGIPYSFATTRGRIVQSHEAYKASGTTTLVPTNTDIIFVECAVMGLTPVYRIDHHNEGDPGFGKLPHEYLEGSSLGQVLDYLGIEATQEQRIIAAADHCLAHAYQGRCPGVTPAELSAWRIRSRATARGLSEAELVSQIATATEALRQAPTIVVEGMQVAWFDNVPPEVSEASARVGVPFAFIRKESDGRVKSGIRSAPARVVEAWIRTCGLKGIYGDPQRGFAGGYFS